MARNYPVNTREQKFWEQTIDKERDARLQWFEELKGKKDGSSKSKTFAVMKRKIEGDHKPIDLLKGKLPPLHKEADFRRRPAPEAELIADLKDNLVEMKPVTPATKAALYRGFSKEGLGRKDYLRRRKSKDPEVKFDFPLLNSWEYGWKLGEVIKKDEVKAPTYARGKIVQDTFYRRRGVFTSVADLV